LKHSKRFEVVLGLQRRRILSYHDHGQGEHRDHPKEVDFTHWEHIMTNFPGYWKRLIKRGVLHEFGQHRGQEKQFTWLANTTKSAG